MAEELTKKKRVRGGHRASATRTIGRVDEYLAAAGPDRPVETSKLLTLKLNLKEKLETLKLLDSQIVELTGEGELEDEIEQADSFREGIHAAMIKIEEHCTVPAAALPAAATRSQETRPETSGMTSPSNGSRVKLPKLSIRPFNGEITSWTTFWDSYDSAIHQNPALSDIDKFNYLKSLVERTAHEAIAGLALTADNYQEAISTLKKRFGDKQRIIDKHMDTLLHIEAVTSQYNLKGLRRMYDLMESQIRGLRSLGVSSESYGSLLSSVLLSKLPQELRLIVARHTSDSDRNLDNLMKAMESEIEVRERATTDSTQPGRKPSKEQPTAATLLSRSVGPSCCYCQQGHPSSGCQVVTQTDTRKQILRRTGRCFICLRRGHISRECRSTMKCTKCGNRHHTSICLKDSPHAEPHLPSSRPTGGLPVQGTSTSTSSRPGLNSDAAVYPTSSNITLYANLDKAILLQTAQAPVCNPTMPNALMRVRIVFDTGSQRSYVSHRIRDALSLTPEGEQHMSIATFGSCRRDPQLCEVVQICVRLRDGQDKLLKVFTVPLICEPLSCQPITLCAEQCEHLSHLELADCSEGQAPMDVDMLIGADYYWEFTTGKTRRGKGGPTAIHTRIGWVLSGPAPCLDSSTSLMTSTLFVTQEGRLDEQLRSFWELESLGVLEGEQSVYEKFTDMIQFKDGRYEVSLPWKDQHPTLPDNYQLSLKRLHSLLHRLRQDPALLQEYGSIIEKQIRQGIVEVVDHPELLEARRVHYLPHHAVVRRDKETTRLRIVYDASARSDGPSLNDCLYTGPRFNQRVMDILLRFRLHRVALTADIEKAFLMVSVSKEDCDVLRFLWIRDGSEEPTVLRFTRVVFGISSSPFLLNATIKHHLDQFSSNQPELVQMLLRSIYVDDVVTGADDEDRAYSLYVESKDMLARGGFNLRKFATNSSRLQQKIDEEESALTHVEPNTEPGGLGDSDETYAKSTLGFTQVARSGEQKVLGVQWDVETDKLKLDLSGVARLVQNLEPTKRNVVSVVGRIYDPLGFLSPVTIMFKMFFQELCESEVGWDQPLTENLLVKWRTLTSGLQEAQPISIPRYHFRGLHSEAESYRLCGFCDASTRAYAAVVYLVTRTSEADHLVEFVAAKTRVAPLKAQTVPRLELLSALLLARLVKNLTHSLEPALSLTPPRCFTDSQVTLCWIRGQDKEWRQFVQNRVLEVRKLTPVDSWRHCSGSDNPADLPSRGLAPLDLSVSELWRNGPSWLAHGEIEGNAQELTPTEECLAEMKTKCRGQVSLLVTEKSIRLEELISCHNYSTLRRLLAVTAFVLRYVRVLKFKAKLSIVEGPRSLVLEADEVAKAEVLWVIESQSQLTKDKDFGTWKKQFGLFLDHEGMWRCGGRLTNADLPYSTRYPVLLPRKYHFTILIVKSAHGRVLHNGVKETLSELRSRYWIVKGRSLVKSIIHQCVVCRRFDGRACCTPPPPPLPTFRVREEPPFTYSGVDFAGPLYVRATGARESTKVWVCLYTCCIVRAVHLDLVPDLTAPAFIRSFKRFTARRGLPRKVISDNGKTFKAASKIIHAVMSHESVQQYLLGIGVEWAFNLPKAPWWGGVFERLIKSTKRCLKKMIGQAKLTYDELLTAVIEVEMILNSRPLSYVSADDMEEPLTPSHLMIGRRVSSLPDNLCHAEEDSDEEITPALLGKRARHLNKTLNQFWRRWRREYLLELRECHRHNTGDPKATSVSVGDVVIIHDKDRPRGFWRLAVVKDTLKGQDGTVRGAILRTTNKGGHSMELRWPIQLLYPLEVSDHAEAQMEDVETSSPGDETVVRGRPRRVAASAARDRMLACHLNEED